MLLIHGCNTQSEIEIQNMQSKNISEHTMHVSIEEAKAKLLIFMDELSDQTRSNERRKIANITTLEGNLDSRSSDISITEPLIYLFNFEDNEGYALVSGDRRVHDILAFVEKGHLDPNKGTDNPGLAIFLSNIDIYYRHMTGLPIYSEQETGTPMVCNDGDDYNPDIDEDYVEYSDWTTTGEYGNKINCTWGQNSPFNNYCYTDNGEQAVAGCVAIAVAQIMFYHGLNYTYNGTLYDWNIIRGTTGSYTGTQESRDMAARLVADLGKPENLDMNYGTETSGASNENVARTFYNFGYTSVGSLQDFDGNTLSLRTNPLYVSGYARRQTILDTILGVPVTNYYHTSGHSWVIDTKLTQRRYKYTYLYNGVLAKTEIEDRYLYHCNWGWNGQDDGYYLANAFDTVYGPEVRSTSYWEGYDGYYRFLLKMIPDIKP